MPSGWTGSEVPLLATFFTVTIDGVQLGSWTGVSGIGMSIKSDAKLDSAVNFMQNHLPGPLSYDPITLTRIPNSYTSVTMAWFSSYHTLPVPMTAEICGKDSNGEIIISWELIGVTPSSWKGPQFKVGEANPGVETLVLNHWGFL
jgi:phage tail-like protein